MITSIRLADDGSNGYTTQEGLISLDDLRRVNLIIGANNSGKSRFARLLVKSKDNVLFNTSSLKVYEWLPILEDTYKRAKTIQNVSFRDQSKPFNWKLEKWEPHFNNLRKQHVSIGEANKLHSELVIRFTNYLEDLEVHKSAFDTSRAGPAKHVLSMSHYQEVRNTIKKLYTNNDVIKFIYIPMLRSVKWFAIDSHDGTPKKTSRDLFKETIIHDYFSHVESFDKNSVRTGLDIYDEFQKMLLGEPKARKDAAEFEKWIGSSFFEGKEVALIPRIQDKKLYVNLGGEELPLENLGDGIQQLISILFPVFEKSQERAFFFIEEPEVNLHPGFQRVLLETLLRSDIGKNHQYFLVTHSNHFLDMAVESDNVSIYKVSKHNIEKEGAKFEISNEPRSSRQLLEELGVRPSSVFLSNCTIWVEGISDRIYIRRYLELYWDAHTEVRRYQEDLHFSFVEYGGANFGHWDFIDNIDDEDDNERSIRVNRLCGKGFIVVDNDGLFQMNDACEWEPKTEKMDGEVLKKAKRVLDLKKILKERVHILGVNEVENLLSPSVLEKTVRKFCSSPSKSDAPPIYQQDAYKDVKIWEYLRANSESIGPLPKSEYIGRSKRVFAVEATMQMNSWEDLSESAKDLIEEIVAFIKKMNT